MEEEPVARVQVQGQVRVFCHLQVSEADVPTEEQSQKMGDPWGAEACWSLAVLASPP